MYEKEFSLSFLYPFSTQYYRKFGYEVGAENRVWTVPLQDMKTMDVGGRDVYKRQGIGDVTLPLPEVVVSAFQAAVLEQGTKAGFHGYGPEQGYAFLREAVRNYYMSYGVELEMEDIFISDGAKSDVGNILDLFDRDNQVLIPDPVYPVYRLSLIHIYLSGKKAAENGAQSRWQPAAGAHARPGTCLLYTSSASWNI